jgi:hypothetical protein
MKITFIKFGYSPVSLIVSRNLELNQMIKFLPESMIRDDKVYMFYSSIDGKPQELNLNTKFTSDYVKVIVTTCFFGNKIGPERKLKREEFNYYFTKSEELKTMLIQRCIY